MLWWEFTLPPECPLAREFHAFGVDFTHGSTLVCSESGEIQLVLPYLASGTRYANLILFRSASSLFRKLGSDETVLSASFGFGASPRIVCTGPGNQ